MSRPTRRYIPKFRRRREVRTDYRSRKKLIESGLPLFTVRRTANYIYASFLTPTPDGDSTLASANSKELMARYNLVSGKNTSAAFLVGLLAGLRASRKGIRKAVLSIRPAWTTNASIPFAAAQGASEAGVEIPIGKEAMIDPGRIRGVHIAEHHRLLEEQYPKALETRYTRYREAGLDPKTLPERVDEIKKELLMEASKVV